MHACNVLSGLGLVTSCSSGIVALQNSAFDIAVQLSYPEELSVLRKNGQDDATTYELRLSLLDDGWTIASDLRSASVLHRRLLRTAHNCYFTLLATFELDLLENLNHGGSVAYFRCVEACIRHGTSLDDMPLDRRADFYTDLAKFFQGRCGSQNYS